MPAPTKHFLQIPLFLLFVLFFSGCTQSNNTPESGTVNTYSLHIMTKDANEYIVQTNSLAEGYIDPVKNGVLLKQNDFERNIIIRDGYYYYMNSRANTFYKYALQKNTLQKIDSVALKNLYVSNHTWISTDTLLLIGTGISDMLIHYVKIHVTDMKKSEGKISLTIPHPSYNGISVGLSHINNSKLFIGYTYHIINDLGYTTSDTAYITVLNYNTMKVLETSKETRSTYPGSDNLIEPAYFTNEKRDLYFLTCPGVALGNKIEKPTALIRIKDNETKIDSTYFFNISASPIHNHAYSIYYLGKNKALIRSERKDLFKNWNEHWKVPHYEFYILDIEKQTVEKLKLPLDKGTRRQCVIVEDNIVYISLNSDTEGNAIWIYNSIDGSLHKGLRLGDEISFILRIDKIK